MFFHTQWGGKKLLHLLPREHDRQLLLQLGQLHFCTGIVREFFSRTQKFVKGAQGRKLEPDVTAGRFFFREMKKIFAKIVGLAFQPLPGLQLFPNLSEGTRIRFQCSWRSVALDRQEAQEFVGQLITSRRYARRSGHAK